MKAKVYFSRQITPEKVVELYKAVGLELPGKVAVKVHSGEPGNQNFLTPEFWQPMVEAVHGTIVECNTAYPGERNTTDAHRRTMIKHGWSKLFDVDILDAEGPDLELPIPNGKRIQKNLVGKDIKNYDSMLVLSHFKGHPMAASAARSNSSPSDARPAQARRTSTARASPKRCGRPSRMPSLSPWPTRRSPSSSFSTARSSTST